MLPFQLFAATFKSYIPVAVCCELICKVSSRRPVTSFVSSKIAFTGGPKGEGRWQEDNKYRVKDVMESNLIGPHVSLSIS